MLHDFSSVLSAVLLLYFGYGTVNPSGKLAETFPRKLSDTPAYLSFPGERETSVYTEGVFVGYRYYDTKEADVLFPFGHGLSYTTFAYSDLRLSHSIVREGEDVQVTVTVTNTGAVSGKETVQFYVTPPKSERHRPVRELKGFAKVSLQPGESKGVQFTLDKRSFAYKSLSRATEMMKNSWKKTLKNNPSYFTDPEKQKVLRFAMQRPANYLTEIETYLEKALAEALEEEKTA